MASAEVRVGAVYLNTETRGCKRNFSWNGKRDSKGGVTDTETALLQSLIELEEKVASMKTAQPKPNLLPLFERLDVLTASLPRTADPTLLHYLHKRSYQKARLFLQGRDAENAEGNCGHV